MLADRRETLATPETISDPSVQQPVTPPHQRAPSIPEDPAVSLTGLAFSARSLPRRPNDAKAPPPFPVTAVQRSVSQRTPASSSNRLRDRTTSQQSPSSSRPDGSRSSLRSSAQSSTRQRERSASELSSTSRPDASRSSPRSSAQSVTQRQSSTTLRQRDRSTSKRSSNSRLGASGAYPRVISQVGTSARPSLARTMTSGKGNQGMSNRIGGRMDRDSVTPRVEGTGQNRLRAGTVGRKTTSALFRELDELVSQEGGGGDGGQRR